MMYGACFSDALNPWPQWVTSTMLAARQGGVRMQAPPLQLRWMRDACYSDALEPWPHWVTPSMLVASQGGIKLWPHLLNKRMDFGLK